MIMGITFINILVNAASQNITMLMLLGFIPNVVKLWIILISAIEAQFWFDYTDVCLVVMNI